MERTTLAPGLTVSRLALGGCPLGGHGWGAVDTDEAVAAVRRAVERGIDFFDTADVYGLGRSEELLAHALGDDRQRVTIATKFGVRVEGGRTIRDISPAYLRQALEGSLRRLRLECLPLYYVHWPDGATPIEAAVEELDRCRAAGKVRAIGVSNFDADQLRRACRVAPIAALQVQYSLVERPAADLCRAAAEGSVPLVTWGSLAQGLLSGKYSATTRFGPDDRRSRYDGFQGPRLAQNLRLVARVQRLAERLGRTPSQVALRWLLDTPGIGVVLFGAKRPEQVEDNAGALGWRLTAAEYDELNAPSERKAAA